MSHTAVTAGKEYIMSLRKTKKAVIRLWEAACALHTLAGLPIPERIDFSSSTEEEMLRDLEFLLTSVNRYVIPHLLDGGKDPPEEVVPALKRWNENLRNFDYLLR